MKRLAFRTGLAIGAALLAVQWLGLSTLSEPTDALPQEASR
ncbi:hypothetical protein ACFOD4_12845 [Pseudoroseomonas globiformis]|uniref:Uncharacterized protein n=1 Tax=Teichococcus globiformis TaxID=2307229 RepID=A0ABV7G322_9PROT